MNIDRMMAAMDEYQNEVKRTANMVRDIWSQAKRGAR